MKNFYKNEVKKNAVKSVVAIFALSLSIVSCTNVDKTLGTEFVPSDQEMAIVNDTLYPNIYNVTLDSLLTSNMLENIFGSYFDPVFGETNVGFAFQMMPITKDAKFGSNPTVDSVVLKIILEKSIGDIFCDQKIKIYELSKTIKRNIMYFPGMDADTMVYPEEVATYDYKNKSKDRWDIVDTLRIRLKKTLGEKLVKAPEEAMSTDSIFGDYFKGLYIKTEPVAGGKTGRINKILPTNALAMAVYYKYDGKDTVVSYKFDEIIMRPMFKFTTIKHDYSKATDPIKVNAATLNKTADVVPADTTLYLQGLFGVTPKMKLTETDIQKWLDSKKLKLGEIAILKANLEICAYKNRDNFKLKTYPDSLCLFYEKMYGKGNEKYALPFAVMESNSTVFGGAFNKTLFKYSFKMTLDLYAFTKKMDKEKNIFTLLSPALKIKDAFQRVSTQMYNENAYSAVFKGTSSSTPPRLIITYLKSGNK